jgi:hypothetical protein
MGDATTVPVVSGLAIGIAFIMLVSSMPKPDSLLSDEELIAKYSKLPEIKYFLGKYPDAKVEVDRNPHEQYFVILFTAERQVNPERRFDSGIHSLGVSVHAPPFRQAVLFISCGAGGMTTDRAVESIETIEDTEKWCFQPTPQFYSGEFEPEIGVGKPVPIEKVSDDDTTSIEIRYEED